MDDRERHGRVSRYADGLLSEGAAPAGIASLRILIVEDNAHVRTILVTILRAFGVRLIREAQDGVSAFEALRFWKPDVILLDLVMTGVDGLAFARAVRNGRDSPAPEIPIIVISGNSEVSRVAAARDAGVSEFVAKPLRAGEVWKRLTSVIYSDRTFVRTATYYGPDRRRGAKPGFNGPFKRKADRAATAIPALEID